MSANRSTKVAVAVNGFGVIGKRVAAAVTSQPDMELAGVADVVTDWRGALAQDAGYPLYGASEEYTKEMAEAGHNPAGSLDDLLSRAEVVVDCTPKKVTAGNVVRYRERNLKFILQDGEKHDVTGHSFSTENNYDSALGRQSTRVVSCNTTATVRTLRSEERRVGKGCRSRW